MQTILFLFPAQYLAEYAREVLAGPHPDILVDHCPPRLAPQLMSSYVRQGVGILGARGGIANAVRQAGIDLPLVDIPVTAFDIVKALTEAARMGERIAVLAHADMVPGLEPLASMLGLAITRHTIAYNQNYDSAVSDALDQGANVIIGGALACEAASKRGIPHALLRFGEQSLLQAANEAERMRQALEQDSAKRDVFRIVLNTSQEAVLVVGRDGTVEEANATAEKLLGPGRVKGCLVRTVLPQLPADENGSPRTGQFMLEVGGAALVSEVVPIRGDAGSFGTVVTLQRTGRIQRMEAMIRKNLYGRGHTARFRFSDVIGESPAIRQAVDLAMDYAATSSSVLILGETGTGKEMFAQSIHNAGTRSSGPFVAVNCAAIPTPLLESELFGYVGGAFTGASKEGKPGLFEVAHGGTIFLDEIAEMDYANQSRLLRFHQERTVVRLGSHKVNPVDVRIIAATNKHLEELVALGSFRDDLYYRLNVLRLELPPLRERTGDARLFAEVFLTRFATEHGKALRLDPAALDLLASHPWPGNVRECRNLMERAAARCKTGTVTAAMIRDMLGPTRIPSRSGLSPLAGPAIAPARADLHVRQIRDALESSRGHCGRAAALLGIDRSTLYRRMKRYGLA